MKSNTEIKLLFQKFILNQCNEKEINEVVNLFQKKSHSEEFPTVEEVLVLLDDLPGMSEENSEKIFQNIIDAKKQKKKKFKNWKRHIQQYAAVAVFIGIVFTGFLYQHLFLNFTDDYLVPREQEVTLQRGNGVIEVIESGKDFHIADSKGHIIGSSKGNKLVYNKTSTSEVTEYNTINVPYGKKFELSLSDGTRVHLNAGTSFRFPVSFIEGNKRQVFLTGEAYFDVAKDPQHSFIVNADDLKVQVFGTQFNVAAYPEDVNTDVVLVEGSVGMFVRGEKFEEGKSTLLSPGFQGRFYKKNHSFSKKEVVTNIHTSWIDGDLIFREISFENILKKLERHYNITIINKKEELNKVIFNANFGNESIEKVLDYFNRIYEINYTIKDNQVIIE